MDAKTQLTQKLTGLNTELLKDTIIGLMDDFRDGAGTVQEFALSELEGRIPKAEFITFCEGL